MALELTSAEAELLLEVLRNELSELRTEIHRTETRDFKEELKAREAHLEAIIGRLEGQEGSESAPA
jgi:hypothetical protein